MPSFPTEYYLEASKKDQQNGFDITNQLFSISEFFQSSDVQKLLGYFKDNERCTNQLAKIKEYANKDANANKYVNIINTRVELTSKIEANERGIKRKITKILNEDSLKEQLRKLAQINVQLIGIQKKLINYLSEEQIAVKEYETLNRAINKEFDRLCFEPIHEIYKQDTQTILKNGITETVLPYLKNLCRLNPEINKLAGNEIANYYMETAEQLIEQNSQSAMTFSNIGKIDLNTDSLYEISVNEDESLTPLYTADSEESVIELVLNGANPIKESKGFANTPLEHQFSLRYIENQSLNRVNIDIHYIKDKLNHNLVKAFKTELNQTKKLLKEEKKELMSGLEKKEKLIKAHMRAVVLRDSETDPSTYADISQSEKYLQMWNDHKREVEGMKLKQLAVDCTAYDFLTYPLEKLPDVSKKTWKSVIANFPQYQQELVMQKNIIDNYRLVQGPQETKQAPALNSAAMMYLNQSVQQNPSMDARFGVSAEKNDLSKELKTQKLPSPELTKEPIQKKPSSRLVHSSFFYGVGDNDGVKKKDVMEKEQASVSRSRFHKSSLFSHALPAVDSSSQKEAIVRKKVGIRY